jgi:hypothetical protein
VDTVDNLPRCALVPLQTAAREWLRKYHLTQRDESAMEAVRRLQPSQPDPEPKIKVAPHNIEAEQALLGAVLVNNEAFYRVSDFLEPIHFYEPIHRDIY